MADVAGGSGPVLAGVLAARPGLRGMLVEAPGVLDEADGHLRRAGVRDRVELAEGDMFERIDAEADLYVLKDILHDWDDERSLQILRTVAAAMRPGSKLVLVEQLLDRNEADPIAASVDLHMLTQCDGGRQRSSRRAPVPDPRSRPDPRQGPRDRRPGDAGGARLAGGPQVTERKRNPFTSSAKGGQTLSALQLPFFLLRPPSAYAVLTTRGRKTGKTRRRCVRAVRRGETVYLVAIKGSAKTGWVKNALANSEVRLRLPEGSFSGRARLLEAAERAEARNVYAGTVAAFDRLTYMNWRKGRPTEAAIQALTGTWFDEGFPIAIDVSEGRS